MLSQAPVSTFSMGNVLAGQMSYQHNGQGGRGETDQFEFTVNDGEHAGFVVAGTPTAQPQVHSLYK